MVSSDSFCSKNNPWKNWKSFCRKPLSEVSLRVAGRILHFSFAQTDGKLGLRFNQRVTDRLCCCIFWMKTSFQRQSVSFNSLCTKQDKPLPDILIILITLTTIGVNTYKKAADLFSQVQNLCFDLFFSPPLFLAMYVAIQNTQKCVIKLVSK